MSAFWEFFEGLDEMVYVSDMDTNQLVYMNSHLRKTLGFSSHEEYRGRHCYRVLQGQECPCHFCTNRLLEPGKFLSWNHKNPVMDKRFLIKDSMFVEGGRRYRIEIAIDMNAEVAGTASYYFARSESLLNECLQWAFAKADPEESLGEILAFFGQVFHCDRAYIFELEGDCWVSNTYEWCAPGVPSQRELLQREPLASIDWWIQSFNQGQVVQIPDVEALRLSHPAAYATLQPQGVRDLAAGPIYAEKQLVGFLGVDNPGQEMSALVPTLMKSVGPFVAALLKRRQLVQHLHELSFRDPLTGVLNRHALAEYRKAPLQMHAVGVLCCDIVDLKALNDSDGEAEGDRLVRRCCQLMREAVETELVFRTDGDKFVALRPECSREDFHRRAEVMRRRIREELHPVAVGSAWSDQAPLALDSLLEAASGCVEAEKAALCERRPPAGSPPEGRGQNDETLFQQFLSVTSHDFESLFQSIAQQNSVSYFYFGDVQQDLFYISDNMRDEFGFSSNVVSGLFQSWAERITTPRFRERFQADIASMMNSGGRRTVHDQRYQVRGESGESVWVRSYGLLKWNEDQTAPQFFSGRLTHQDNAFVVDPITNFPRVQAMLGHLEKVLHSGGKTTVIGFSLNNILDINNTYGRAYADRLLRNTADRLMAELSGKLSFYRLEGTRFAALPEAGCQEPPADLVEEIRAVVTRCYGQQELSIRRPCSFGVMEFPHGDLRPEDLLESVMSLIKVAKHDVGQPYVGYSTENLERIREMSDMAMALSRDVMQGMEHFRVVIQPVVSAENGEILGGEVLMRWTFQGQDVSPAVFIPLLEKDGTIFQAGRWVFEQAVRSCSRLTAYLPEFYLTFNVSLCQLSDSRLPEFMAQTLRKYRLDGRHLVAEMTESSFDEQPEKLREFVDACDRMGIRMALDDFGSGYSSMRMLLQYPSSIIKLDRSLLPEITESDQKLHFIRSIVYACHQFGKRVCMEGVENEEQNVSIRDTGCDMIQGFYYYRPLELPDLYHLLSRP